MENEGEKMRSLMIDHIDGNLTGELKKYVESHIKKDEGARREYDQLKKVMNLMDEDDVIEPKPESREKFLDIIEKEKRILQEGEKNEHSINLHLRWNTIYKVAAAISLVVVGFLAGQMIYKDDREMAALQQEIRETRELVMLSLMNEESASERLKGVMTSYDVERADEQIIDVLIHTMNNDQNVNVRIASVEALGRFSGEEKVKSALIDALSRQDYPAVQIRLIDMLVEMGDPRALEPLKELAEDENEMESVRDQAHMGIFKLM